MAELMLPVTGETAERLLFAVEDIKQQVGSKDTAQIQDGHDPDCHQKTDQPLPLMLPPRSGCRICCCTQTRMMNCVAPAVAEEWSQHEKTDQPAREDIEPARSEQGIVGAFMQQQLKQEHGGGHQQNGQGPQRQRIRQQQRQAADSQSRRDQQRCKLPWEPHRTDCLHVFKDGAAFVLCDHRKHGNGGHLRTFLAKAHAVVVGIIPKPMGEYKLFATLRLLQKQGESRKIASDFS
ncbi:MAG: hypothetical protein RLZZ436_3634 [Planctomycetota bacterium]